MPINPELLELSIQECYSKFLDYLQLVKNFIQNSLSFWEERLEWEEIEKIEAKANSYYCKQLINLEWQCTKNNPSHTKLRFFLALILSLKDLERCCDYLYSLSRLARQDTKKQLREIILNSRLWDLIFNSFQNIYNFFKNSGGRIKQDSFQKILNEKTELQSELCNLSLELNHKLITQWETNHNSNNSTSDNLRQLEWVKELLFLSRLLQITLVKTDRFLDHVFNIVENFYYIKNQELSLNQDARLSYTLSLLNEKHLKDS